MTSHPAPSTDEPDASTLYADTRCTRDGGYLAVWSELTAALDGLPVPRETATALWHARRTRLGVQPVRALFDLLRGPASAIRTAGARWAGLLVVAIDGTGSFPEWGHL